MVELRFERTDGFELCLCRVLAYDLQGLAPFPESGSLAFLGS